MPSKRELLAGLAFFALAAGALVLFRRPFDFVGWAGLAGCVAFVVLACYGLVKPGTRVGRREIDDPATPELPWTIGDAPLEDIPIGDPSPDELRIFETTIAALEAVGGLQRGEIDACSLWRAAQRLDPGRAIGVYEAVSSFAALHDDGHPRIGRLIFVPAHTEYDALLLAEITACTLASLGHAVQPRDITVTLPPDGNQGTARVAFPIEGCTRTVSCEYLWKYPPADLIPALRRFGRPEDPRDLVCADPGDQTLLYAAIRSGSLMELNHRLPAADDIFHEA
ncbi:hypothetical protein [Methylobacterium tarhaniae]|uniref:hypothetical protein n=1 Tax=Methylobacterium tarhaniae TaxID=1187852 RepID=UPI003D042BDA